MNTESLSSLKKQVINKLISHWWHISCAESCTGGLLASTLVSVANASSVLSASFVTYSEEAKVTYAHVSPSTISRYGVVSEEVAREMAIGVAKETSAEVGVGVTGIAGPTGGTDELPVGTVCFGFSVNGAVTTKTMHFGPVGRNQVRKLSVKFALKTLYELT